VVFVNQTGTVNPVNFTVTPTTGGVPLTVTASASMTIPSGTITACGTLTYGTIDWGDGTTDVMTYLGCNSNTQIMTKTHTYGSIGTYTARLIANSGSVEGTKIITVGGNVNFTSLWVVPTVANRGEELIINWAFPTAYTDSRVRLEIREANGAAVGESGIASQLLINSGTYAWRVPSATEPCLADAGRVCGSQIINGRQYIVRALVYSPVNACFGYCVGGTGPTIIATRDSNVFTVNGTGTGGTGNTALTVVNDGIAGAPYMITATTQTLTAGSSCVASDVVLDYGNGQTQIIPVTNSGSSSCGVRSTTYTHYYSAPGTYTLYLRSAAFPYTVQGQQTITVN
jgi:PKD repeat protein